MSLGEEGGGVHGGGVAIGGGLESALSMSLGGGGGVHGEATAGGEWGEELKLARSPFRWREA